MRNSDFDLGEMRREAGFHGVRENTPRVKGKGGAVHYPMAGMRPKQRAKVLMPGEGSIMGTSYHGRADKSSCRKPTFQRRTKDY